MGAIKIMKGQDKMNLDTIYDNVHNITYFEDNYSKYGEKLFGFDIDADTDIDFSTLIEEGFIPVRAIAGYSVENGPEPKIERTRFLRKTSLRKAHYLVKKPSQVMIESGIIDSIFNYNSWAALNFDQTIAFDIYNRRKYDAVLTHRQETNLVYSVFSRSFVSKKPEGTVSHYRRAA
ncbi:hypothetical protein [Agrobacterium tumefaciens]|uniref:Uncharacterized protein n=1 Tax=Agrobacterium tumefaciens TaxID=358 RepID=A0AA44F8Z9_AGRTU|nr:hypothetical protein [Agrobacterium tumefaciens]NTB86842.1 hypothetical protein [Agrobacterium tumefaciens]NTC21171.1 hypothetical protein [Agrobacterium tumefaciens]NTC30719.1 hypothetical protein [Agrobacterium tumefaciens]